MKKSLLFLILAISASVMVAAPAPKQKKIKYSNYAYYEGMALKKSPQGRGTLHPCNRCVVTGVFNNNKIHKGKIVFKEHRFTITGEFTFAVMGKEQFLIVVNSGKFNSTTLPKNTPIRFNEHNYSFESHYAYSPKLPNTYYELLRQFAGETTYKIATDGRAKSIYNNENRTRKFITRPSYLEVSFPGGTTARYDVAERKSRWLRPNGDFIEFVSDSDGTQKVLQFKITAGKATITKTEFSYIFENGNKYTGTVKEEFLKGYSKAVSLEKILSFNGFYWKWSEFKDKALDGVVVYPDGRSEKVVKGLTDSENARIKAERIAEENRIAAEKEAKRKAAEEAARVAAEEEAKRKAAEEAARIAAEKEVQREAEVARPASEHKDRKGAEMGHTPTDRVNVVAEKEAQMRAEVERLVAERERIAAEIRAKREADHIRITAEREQESIKKVQMRIVSAFEFMVNKKSHTSISQDNQVPRFFYHPTFNPYSPDFRAELNSRLSEFCPCVGYEIVSINEDRVVCLLKKEADGMVSVYQLSIVHKEGILNITSFDITKANKIE